MTELTSIHLQIVTSWLELRCLPSLVVALLHCPGGDGIPTSLNSSRRCLSTPSIACRAHLTMALHDELAHYFTTLHDIKLHHRQSVIRHNLSPCSFRRSTNCWRTCSNSQLKIVARKLSVISSHSTSCMTSLVPGHFGPPSPLLQDVRVSPTRNFGQFRADSPLFQLLESLFRPKRKPKILNFYPTRNFGHFRALSKMSCLTI